METDGQWLQRVWKQVESDDFTWPEGTVSVWGELANTDEEVAAAEQALLAPREEPDDPDEQEAQQELEIQQEECESGEYDCNRGAEGLQEQQRDEGMEEQELD